MLYPIDGSLLLRVTCSPHYSQKFTRRDRHNSYNSLYLDMDGGVAWQQSIPSCYYTPSLRYLIYCRWWHCLVWRIYCRGYITKRCVYWTELDWFCSLLQFFLVDLICAYIWVALQKAENKVKSYLICPFNQWSGLYLGFQLGLVTMGSNVLMADCPFGMGLVMLVIDTKFKNLRECLNIRQSSQILIVAITINNIYC